MSDIFERDIEDDDFALQDDRADEKNEGNFVYPDLVYRARLDYSCEGLYATAAENLPLKTGDRVILTTRYGKDMARILGRANGKAGISAERLCAVDRKATDADIKKAANFLAKEKEAGKIFCEKVAFLKLDMKFVCAHFLLEEPKILFFFSSENRVDFRALVKELVAVLKMRIELRQIGVRDEARITGGLGSCGRPFCCHAISDRLKPVSIKMAKDQNMSLNSMKISGQCGRLLCCLSYEHEIYAEARRSMPPEGTRFFYDGANFKVVEINPVTRSIRLSGEDGRVLVLPASRVSLRNTRWTID